MAYWTWTEMLFSCILSVAIVKLSLKSIHFWVKCFISCWYIVELMQIRKKNKLHPYQKVSDVPVIRPASWVGMLHLVWPKYSFSIVSWSSLREAWMTFFKCPQQHTKKYRFNVFLCSSLLVRNDERSSLTFQVRACFIIVIISCSRIT